MSPCPGSRRGPTQGTIFERSKRSNRSQPHASRRPGYRAAVSPHKIPSPDFLRRSRLSLRRSRSVLAIGKLRKGERPCRRSETFHCDPAGSTPARQRPVSQPEASLAWAAATPFVKRRQQVLKPREVASKSADVGAFAANGAGAASAAPSWTRCRRSGRGLEPGQRYGMDCLGTYEIPFASTRRLAGDGVTG
jgi:hypothetical protein